MVSFSAPQQFFDKSPQLSNWGGDSLRWVTAIAPFSCLLRNEMMLPFHQKRLTMRAPFVTPTDGKKL
jgi:hypothetical protein